MMFDHLWLVHWTQSDLILMWYAWYLSTSALNPVHAGIIFTYMFEYFIIIIFLKSTLKTNK